MRSISTSRPGEILPGALYSREEAVARLGWGKAAWRSALHDGLPVFYRGGRAYVFADDLIQFIRDKAKKDRLGESAGSA